MDELDMSSVCMSTAMKPLQAQDLMDEVPTKHENSTESNDLENYFTQNTFRKKPLSEQDFMLLLKCFR